MLLVLQYSKALWLSDYAKFTLATGQPTCNPLYNHEVVATLSGCYVIKPPLLCIVARWPVWGWQARESVNSGLDYWTGILNWNTGVDYWTALNILRSCVSTYMSSLGTVGLGPHHADVHMHLHVYNVLVMSTVHVHAQCHVMYTCTCNVFCTPVHRTMYRV